MRIAIIIMHGPCSIWHTHIACTNVHDMNNDFILLSCIINLYYKGTIYRF